MGTAGSGGKGFFKQRKAAAEEGTIRGKRAKRADEVNTEKETRVKPKKEPGIRRGFKPKNEAAVKTEKEQGAKTKPTLKKGASVEVRAASGEKSSALSGNSSIMGTLIKAFLVPIVLIIILGAVSYITASNTIKKQVEESSVSTLSAMGMYCELMTGNVSSKALELVAGDNLSDYYDSYAKRGNSDAMQYWRDAKKNLLQVKASVQYIYSYSIIPEYGTYLSSLSGSMGDDVLQGFLESAEGQYFPEGDTRKTAWLGYHSFLDERFKIDSERYGLVFYQKFLKTDTFLVLDITMETVEKMLNEMDFGENSIKGMVTPDGREIIRIQREGEGVKPESTEPVFTDKEFFTKSIGAAEVGSEYVKYNGSTYLYLYTPIGKTGIMMCSLIPQDNIIKEVSFIRNICVAMIILACIIAFVIGSRIASGMSKSVKIMTNGLDKVAEGDLTQSFHIKRKDEFGLLAKGLNDMLASMRTLMADMKKFGNQVKEMEDGVAVKSDTINTSIKEISNAVDDVASGTQTQAKEADLSNSKMAGFAEKVDSACDGADDMGNTIDRATAAVGQGRIIVDELSRKTETTVEITKVLVDNINDVGQRSSEIEGFIDTINSIARQTNLLSLNASIEAARAGENGRGFAVVAEEIRQLADESMQAGKNIKKIVENIVETTQKTTDSAKEAETIVYAQADALKETIQVFGEINQCVESLVNGLKEIANSMREINGEKDMVQESIRSISVVSEQAAVATEEVTAALDGQVKIVSDLTEEVELLKEEADALDQSLSRFLV